MNRKRPKVGLGVLVFKNGKVLLGKRRRVHGKGEFGGLGGHLEFGESFEKCIKRECLEEAGIKIKNLRFIRLSNVKKYGGKHYVDIGFAAEWESGEPKALEPHKLEYWDWYDLDNLPEPLFEPIIYYLDALKTQNNYSDS